VTQQPEALGVGKRLALARNDLLSLGVVVVDLSRKGSFSFALSFNETLEKDR
jgi:hypothetical protein